MLKKDFNISTQKKVTPIEYWFIGILGIILILSTSTSNGFFPNVLFQKYYGFIVYHPYGYMYNYVHTLLEVSLIIFFFWLFYYDYFKKPLKRIRSRLKFKGIWASWFIEIFMLVYCVAVFKIVYMYNYGIDPLIALDIRLYEVSIEPLIKKDLIDLARQYAGEWSPFLITVITLSADILNSFSLAYLPSIEPKGNALSLNVLFLNLLQLYYSLFYISFIILLGRPVKKKTN